MLKLLRFQSLLLKRHFSASNDVYLTQCLNERTLLEVSGGSAQAFLQGLITNDMAHLEGGATSMFCMLLNSIGRVKYDSIIYNCGTGDKYLMECDSNAVDLVKDHMNLFKVRRKAEIISMEDNFRIWAVVKQKNFLNITEAPDYAKIMKFMETRRSYILSTVDPRLPFLGLRIITPKNYSLTDELQTQLGVTVKEENFYKLLRYKLGVGEGPQELPYEKCFPMEANGDYLHGISFHKGCYLGQELTARTYHTGVIRKRLMPLLFSQEINITEQGIPIFPVPESPKPIGKLLGITETYGLGLLRINEALLADELMVLDAKCKTHRPFWWPSELPKERVRVQ